MRKEQLKQYLNDQMLMQVIGQKIEASKTRTKLCDALSVATETNLSAFVLDEIKSKLALFNKICRRYSDMLEDVWGINWRAEEIIKRHMHLTNNEIDELPDVLKN